MPASTPPLQAGQLIRARDTKLLVVKECFDLHETVPNFVPTTKPYRVLLSVGGSLESIAGYGFQRIPSQLVAHGVSCWFLVRPVFGTRGSEVQILSPRPYLVDSVDSILAVSASF